MAERTIIKTKTFFQIPPNVEDFAYNSDPDRVVFMDQGFDLNSIHHIGECVQVGDLWYQFSVELRSPDKKVNFDFKRKNDCLMAQRELTRAWTKTGEFGTTDQPNETEE